MDPVQPAALVGRGGGLKFRPSHRLRSSSEFRVTLSEGRRVRGKHLLAYYRNASLEHARLGIVVGKRFARQSVERNLFRRLCRESFRSTMPRLPAFDIVVRLTAPLRGVGKRQLRAEMDDLLLRLTR